MASYGERVDLSIKLRCQGKTDYIKLLYIALVRLALCFITFIFSMLLKGFNIVLEYFNLVVLVQNVTS